MIRTVLTLDVDPARVADVIEMYRAEDILQDSLDHSDALSSELSVATEIPGRVMVTALWPDAASYQAWLDNPWRRESSVRLGALLAGAVGSGALFEVIQSVVKG